MEPPANFNHTPKMHYFRLGYTLLSKKLRSFVSQKALAVYIVVWFVVGTTSKCG